MIVKDNGKTLTKEKIITAYKVSVEAIKISQDYPELTVEECLKKAKEIYSYDEN